MSGTAKTDHMRDCLNIADFELTAAEVAAIEKVAL